MKIHSLHVGIPKTVPHEGQMIETGIFKAKILGPVLLKTLNLEGDSQADLRVHGGRDKALYAYAHDAYIDWKRLRPRDEFEGGAMGENLCLDSIFEDQIFIGDTFEVGEAVIQVTQPRFPCYKLAIKFKDTAILKQFMKLNRPGVYFRVLKEGLIDVGQTLRLVGQEEVHVSVTDLFRLNEVQEDNPFKLQEILQLKSLNETWRKEIESKLSHGEA